MSTDRAGTWSDWKVPMPTSSEAVSVRVLVPRAAFQRKALDRLDLRIIAVSLAASLYPKRVLTGRLLHSEEVERAEGVITYECDVEVQS